MSRKNQAEALKLLKTDQQLTTNDVISEDKPKKFELKKK